jgi:hypothetical protein
MAKQSLVVNLYGGPGVGKSTIATGIVSAFNLVKDKTLISAELAPEYAKEITWRGIQQLFFDQVYIFAKQQHRLHYLMGKVDVIVTDAPLLNNILYVDPPYPSFPELVLETIRGMENYNILLERVKSYDPVGRNQTEEEAKVFDSKIETLLKKYEMPYRKVPGNAEGLAIAIKKVAEEVLALKRGEYIMDSYTETGIDKKKLNENLEECKKKYDKLFGLSIGEII